MIWIALIYLAALFAIPPIFNYPIIDDWAYERSVEILLTHGRIRILEWTAANLIFQVFYGALLCRIFGFSLQLLRYSTLALSFLATLCSLSLLRRLGFGKGLALAGTLVLLLNPLYFLLSYSFMTDVPFLFFMLLSLLLYAKGVSAAKQRWFLLGSLSAIAAALIRQYGILIPIALFLWLLAQKRLTLKSAIIVLGLPSAAYALFLLWFKYGHGLPTAFLVRGMPFRLSYIPVYLYTIRFRFWSSLFALAHYMGLFLMPLLLAGIFSRRCWRDLLAGGLSRALFIAWTVFIGGGTIYYLAACGRVMPYGGTMLINFGIGPLNLRDTYILHKPNPLQLPFVFWLGVTALSSVGAIVLGTLVLRRLSYCVSRTVASLSKRQLRLVAAGLIALSVLCVISLTVVFYSERNLIDIGRWLIEANYDSVKLGEPSLPGKEYFLRELPGFTKHMKPWLSIVGFSLLLVFLSSLEVTRRAARHRTQAPSAYSKPVSPRGFLLTTGSLMLLVTLYMAFFFDRYLLVLLFPAVIVILAWWKEIGFSPSPLWLSAGLLALGIFTLGSAHDYLSWNRARWEGLAWLTEERGVPVNEIDGGMEFNGRYTYDTSGIHARPGKSWWWVIDDRYMVSFSRLRGYDIIRKIKYKCWLDFRNRDVYILKRKENGA